MSVLLVVVVLVVIVAVAVVAFILGAGFGAELNRQHTRRRPAARPTPPRKVNGHSNPPSETDRK